MKMVSVSEARKQLSAVVNWAAQNNDDVVIQNRGQAQAVIIPYADYQLLKEAREQQRRAAAIAELKRLAQAVRQTTPPLSEQEADALADEVTRDAIDTLIADGKVSFESS